VATPIEGQRTVAVDASMRCVRSKHQTHLNVLLIAVLWQLERLASDFETEPLIERHHTAAGATPDQLRTTRPSVLNALARKSLA
jgi:hypothetical protein